MKVLDHLGGSHRRGVRALCACSAALGLLLASCGRPSRSVRTEPAPGAATAPEATRTHVVVPGDTWASIAEAYFGTPDPAERLARENGSTLQATPVAGESITVRIPAADLPRVRRLAEAREPYNHGVQLLAADNYKEAAAAFQEALRRAPEFVDARYNLALALLRQDKARDALPLLREVTSARASDKDAHYALATAYFHLEQYDQALAAVDSALALDPNFLRARFTRAMVLERSGDASGAREAWQAYLALDSTSAWAQEAKSHLQSLP